MLTEEKALKITQMLKERKGEGSAPAISHALGVSGKEIHKVTKMIERGLIAYSEEGNPYFITPFKQIEKYYLKREREMEPEEIAHKTVRDAVEGAVAAEAALQTEQYFILGKAIWQAFSNWAIRKGMTIEDIKNTPIHQVIIDSLEKADKLESVQQEIQELKRQLAYLQGETNPLIRLKTTLKKSTDIVAALAILDQAGFNNRIHQQLKSDLLWLSVLGAERKYQPKNTEATMKPAKNVWLLPNLPRTY